MSIVALVVAGLIIGVIARLLMPGRDPIGVVGTILVGIVGMVVGSYLWAAAFGDTQGVEWVGGIIATVALLYLYRRVAVGRGTV
ncbi:MAG TPA: GlsB/YeaQ/YmgE family stress response membrane protein [Actinomycetota bacterium]|nr:GlsB/YeaQ/YmgE family stress response membrane protein [Actinomycetota bacterium]